MEVAALAIAIVSIVVAGGSVYYAWRSARAAEEATRISADQHRREREPQIRIWLPTEEQARVTDDRVIYRLINEGPDDLESVVVHRPFTTADSVVRQIAVTGGTDWQDDADFGALPIGAERQFTVSIGTASEGQEEPDLRVRIVCRRGTDSWELVRVLDEYRFHLGIY
jgi:hypothetical protein